VINNAGKGEPRKIEERSGHEQECCWHLFLAVRMVSNGSNDAEPARNHCNAPCLQRPFNEQIQHWDNTVTSSDKGDTVGSDEKERAIHKWVDATCTCMKKPNAKVKGRRAWHFRSDARVVGVPLNDLLGQRA